MELVLYKNLSDDNVLDKNIVEIKRVTGTLQTRTSVTNPIIWVDNDISQLGCNYAEIPDLQRFYFVNDIVLMKKTLYSVLMTCDVLMTFKNEIRASTGHITRQAAYNPYYADYETESRKEYRKVPFAFEFPQKTTMVLVAATSQNMGQQNALQSMGRILTR